MDIKSTDINPEISSNCVINPVVRVYEDFIIADKGIQPTVPLKKKAYGISLLEQVSVLYPEVMNVTGKNPWEGGALHRLDNETTGAVLFARNQKFYNYIIRIQNEDKFIKYYTAKCNITGSSDLEAKSVESYFRAFGPGRKAVKPETDPSKADSDRLYRTDIDVLDSDGTTCTFRCTITRGFRHQIRAHLASIGCPILGDTLYNPIKTEIPMMLRCSGFEFPLNDGTRFIFTGFDYDQDAAI